MTMPQGPLTRAARSAPAAMRNREPILQVLRDVLPPSALVLEIASGTGEHAVWFSKALSGLTWQPTDLDPEALKSIEAWRDTMGLPNLLPPLRLDAAAETWPVAQADAIVTINMVHIAPWTVTEGLIAGAARVLTPEGLLFLYGPFREGGMHTPCSMRICGLATHPGAYVTSTKSPSSPAATGSRHPNESQCPRTI
jgi:SAM-dependent methyltransferase